MKKMLINSGQVKLLKLLSENDGAVDGLITQINTKIKTLNSMWNYLSSISIADIDPDDMVNQLDQVESIESFLYDMSAKKEAILSSIEVSDGYDAMLRLDSYLDGLFDKANSKVSTLLMLIGFLSKISDKMDSAFSDISVVSVD